MTIEFVTQTEDTYNSCLLDLFERSGWRPRMTAALSFYRASPLLVWQEPSTWVVLTACAGRPNVMADVVADVAGLESIVGKYSWRMEQSRFWVGSAVMLSALVELDDPRAPLRESMVAYLGHRFEARHEHVTYCEVRVPGRGADPRELGERLAQLSFSAVEDALSRGSRAGDYS